MRLVFGDVGEFRNWLRDHASPDRHTVYVTEAGEVIIVPIYSTRPLLIAYIREDAEKLKDALDGFRIYKLKSFDWRHDRSPGRKLPFGLGSSRPSEEGKN